MTNASTQQVRVRGLHFDAAGLRLLQDDGSERSFAYGDVESLHGARIRHTVQVVGDHLQVNAVAVALMVNDMPVVGMPLLEPGPKHPETRLVYAVGLRISNAAQMWYFLSDGFNFRDALGDETGYSSEINLRHVVHHLASACPNAAPDAFVSALLSGNHLPEPVGSIADLA
jgi:hypothetical protein